MTKKQAVVQQYQKAFHRLTDMLNQEKNEATRDASILRFEFTLDLSWKTIKAYLEDEKGVLCNSPKTV